MNDLNNRAAQGCRGDLFMPERKEGAALYRQEFEHDACGIGAVVSIKGEQTHSVVNDALSIVEKLEHRAGKDAAGETGDGVGILLQISHGFFKKATAELGLDLGEKRSYGVGRSSPGRKA